MKYKKKVIFELERYPEKCSECPAFHTSRYVCCNNRRHRCGGMEWKYVE